MALSRFCNKFLNNFDGHMQEIIQGAAVAFLLKASGAGLNFLFSIMLARNLGAHGAGIFFLAITITTIASTLSRVGLDNTVLRFTATCATNNDWQAIKGLYRKSMLVVIAIAICLTLLVHLAAPTLAIVIFKEPELATTIKLISFMIIPHAFFWIQSEFLKGIKKISFSQFVQGTSLPLLAFLGILFLGKSASIEKVVMLYVLATAVTAIIGFTVWLQVRPIGNRNLGKGYFCTKKMFKSSGNLYVGEIMSLIILWATTIFLGVWGSSAEVGIYSVAQRTATLISFILIAVNSISAPKFAALYQQKDLKGLSQTAQHSAKLMTITASPLLLLCLIKPEWIMLAFGKEFSSGALLLSIVAIGQFVNVATGSVGYLLMMSGNERIFRNCQLLSGLVCITLCITLIPTFKATGAAVATAFTLSFTNILATFFVWKRLHITILPILNFTTNNHKN